MNQIIELRAKKAWTQQTLATAAGVSLRTIQRLEREELEPSKETLLAVAGAFDVGVTELFQSEWTALGKTEMELRSRLTQGFDSYEECFAAMATHKQNLHKPYFVPDDDPLRLWIGWRDMTTGVAFMGKGCAFASLPEDKRLRFPKERHWIGTRIQMGEDPWAEGDPWAPGKIEKTECILFAAVSHPTYDHKLDVLLTSNLTLLHASFTQPLWVQLDKLKEQGLSEEDRQKGLVKYVREVLEVLMPKHEERARHVLEGIAWPEGAEPLFEEMFESD